MSLNYVERNMEATNKSLEIRINSIQDAQSVVYHQAAILAAFGDPQNGVDSIEFLIAQEVKQEVNAIIRGVFKVKNFTSYVSPREGNTLFKLPHFTFKPKLEVQETVRPVETVPIKKRGMPKGGWPAKQKEAVAA